MPNFFQKDFLGISIIKSCLKLLEKKRDTNMLVSSTKVLESHIKIEKVFCFIFQENKEWIENNPAETKVYIPNFENTISISQHLMRYLEQFLNEFIVLKSWLQDLGVMTPRSWRRRQNLGADLTVKCDTFLAKIGVDWFFSTDYFKPIPIIIIQISLPISYLFWYLNYIFQPIPICLKHRYC